MITKRQKWEEKQLYVYFNLTSEDLDMATEGKS